MIVNIQYSELQWIATPARLTPARVCYAEMKVMTGLPYKEKRPTVCGVYIWSIWSIRKGTHQELDISCTHICAIYILI